MTRRHCLLSRGSALETLTILPFAVNRTLPEATTPNIHCPKGRPVYQPIKGKLKATIDGGVVPVCRNTKGPPPPTTPPQELSRRRSNDTPPSTRRLEAKKTPPGHDLTTRLNNSSTLRSSCDSTSLLNCNARRATTDLDVLFDGHEVTPVGDTRADYSVIRGSFTLS